MKIEQLSSGQIEKARSLATDEERLAYLKACGVELDDDMLSEVAGGKSTDRPIVRLEPACTKNPEGGKTHHWVKTGKTKKSKFFGLWDVAEFKCTYCKKTRWA